MVVKIEETVTIYPSTPPFEDDHVLSLSHLDADRNLHVTFRYLRVYVNNHHATTPTTTTPFHVITTVLSAALVHYYPFAGTLRHRTSDDRLQLHCRKGKGVPVVHATVDSSLASLNYLDDPNGSLIDPLVPDPDPDYVMDHPMILQVTGFSCGGFVLGTAIHHSLCDGLGATQFFNAMAELARGADRITVEPVWDRSGLLGPRNPPRLEFPVHEFLSVGGSGKVSFPDSGPGERVVRECFPVEELWLHGLKKALLDGSGLNFTTFEALGAFLWQAKVKASGVCGDEKVKFAYSTNIRKIVKPPLPKGYWGNGCVPMYVHLLAKDLLQNPIWETAKAIKASKYQTSDAYVRSFVDFQELHYPEGITAGENVTGFTDWRHLGHSTVDFGWGGPVTVLPLSRTLLGSVEPCFFLPYSSATQINIQNGFRVLVYLREGAVRCFRQEIVKLSSFKLRI